MIDHKGNLVNCEGLIIFNRDELRSDGEIPEPFYTQLGLSNKRRQIFVVRDQVSTSSRHEQSEDSFTWHPHRQPGQATDVDSNRAPGENFEEQWMDSVLRPKQAKSKQELLGKAKTVRTRNGVSNGDYQSSQPLNASSIGIFDSTSTLRKSMRKEPPLARPYKLRRKPLFENVTHEEALKRMKGLILHDDINTDDATLMKELKALERNRAFLKKGGFASMSGQTSKLAIRNLSKVYGKAQEDLVKYRPRSLSKEISEDPFDYRPGKP